MAVVYFSLGSNEGDRLNSLVKATKLIDNLIGKVMHYSSVVESEPWGFESETTFYNMVLWADTKLSPQQILNKILAIEKSLGRTRHGKDYTNRIIDIDILFYDEEQINDESLVIPHPLLHKRKFVLQPLAEIAPDLIHPVFKASISELMLRLNEPNPITIAVERNEFARLLNTLNKH
jgi:2-amino-4-hydroxy-6-hydroxymethyldihydropteridine diphosphokinase